MVAAWIVVGLMALSRLYLGVDYPINVVYAAVVSWALAEATFRWWCPDESFPIRYRRGGNAAHLDLGGARAEAVKRAMDLGGDECVEPEDDSLGIRRTVLR